MDWAGCRSAAEMLRAVRAGVPERKLRLFGCAAARRVWHLLADPRTRAAVEAAERYADGRATADELRAAHEAAIDAAEEVRRQVPYRDGGHTHPGFRYADILTDLHAAPNVGVAVSAPELECDAFLEELQTSVGFAVAHAASPEGYDLPPPDYALRRSAGDAELAAHADIVRCLFPDPARPPTLDDRWRSGAVVALARGIDEARAFDRLPILADALQDAGCDTPDVLDHCRSGGPHWPGCWVIDFAAGGSGPASAS